MESKIRHVALILGAVALLAIAFCIAKGITNTISKKVVEMTPYEVSKLEPEKVKEDKKTVDQNELDVLVFNRNLFNQNAADEDDYVPPEPEEETVEEEEPENTAENGTKLPVLTDLRVLLMGTQVASPAQYSVAIFRPLDGTDELSVYLHEGEELMGEAKILKIVRNRVYMLRHTQNNRLEYLDIETTEDELKQALADNETKKPVEKPNVEKKEEKAEKKAVVDASVIKRVNADTFAIPKATIEEIRKNPNILKDPKFGAIPGIQPVYGGGGISGYRLINVDNSSIYAQLGIKSGDILLNVNGQVMDNPQKAMALFDGLKPGQDVKLTVNRFGKEKTITYQLDE